MQRIDDLEIFAKVGEVGSISGAARSLDLPKASVSRALGRLEAAYRVTLIERTTRRVVLTEIGRRIHAHSGRLRDEMDAIEATVAEFRGAPAGTLRVGCPAIVSTFLAPMLPEFLDRFPAIDLKLKVADRLLPEPHGFDVVLHTGWLADSNLIATKITDLPLMLVASRDYAALHGLPTRPEELGGHAVIGLYYGEEDASTAPHELPARVPPLTLATPAGNVALAPWPRFSSNDQMAVLELVRTGVAIGPVSALHAAPDLAMGRLVRVLPDHPLAEVPALYAVFGTRAAPPPKVRAFVGFLTGKVPGVIAG